MFNQISTELAIKLYYIHVAYKINLSFTYGDIWILTAFVSIKCLNESSILESSYGDNRCSSMTYTLPPALLFLSTNMLSPAHNPIAVCCVWCCYKRRLNCPITDWLEVPLPNQDGACQLACIAPSSLCLRAWNMTWRGS